MLLVRPPAVLLSRFLIKIPEGPPRKDKNLPNVIINEKRNIHAAAHQVRERAPSGCLSLLPGSLAWEEGSSALGSRRMRDLDHRIKSVLVSLTGSEMNNSESTLLF